MGASELLESEEPSVAHLSSSVWRKCALSGESPGGSSALASLL